jgi:hypothetical protein
MHDIRCAGDIDFIAPDLYYRAVKSFELALTCLRECKEI